MPAPRYVRLLAALGPLLLVPSCIFPSELEAGVQAPIVFGELGVASQSNHRGMPQNERGVFETRFGITAQTVDGGAVNFENRGYMDLRDSTGNAWLPDGHAGKFQQIDFDASYSRTVGPVSFRGGVVNYNLPNGEIFPNGVRGATSELYLDTSVEVLEASAFVRVHYDIEEVRDYYVVAGVREGFEINEELTLDSTLQLGLSSDGQTFWNYGLANEEVFSDLLLRVGATYKLTPSGNTYIRAVGAGSLILDQTLQQWFDTINIDDRNLWAELWIGWTF